MRPRGKHFMDRVHKENLAAKLDAIRVKNRRAYSAHRRQQRVKGTPPSDPSPKKATAQDKRLTSGRPPRRAGVTATIRCRFWR